MYILLAGLLLGAIGTTIGFGLGIKSLEEGPILQPSIAEHDGKCRDAMLKLRDTTICPHEDHNLKTKQIDSVSWVICECEGK